MPTPKKRPMAPPEKARWRFLSAAYGASGTFRVTWHLSV